VAVKGALAKGLGGPVDVAPDLDHDGRTEGEVRDEVAIPVLGVLVMVCGIRCFWLSMKREYKRNEHKRGQSRYHERCWVR